MKISTYIHLHILELKYNLISFLIGFFYLFFILYIFSNQLIYLFTNIIINTQLLKYFIFTNITEIFITNIYISFFFTCIIMSHFLCVQSWVFLYKGLYKYENLKIIKIYIYFFFFNIFIFFIIFLNIIPNIWQFFININFTSTFLFNIYFEPKINTYFYFILQLFIYIYLLFIYFYLLCCYFLHYLFNIQIIINLRKFFYLKFLLISLLLTPPDINSQFIYFIYLIICFEILLYLYIYLTQYFK